MERCYSKMFLYLFIFSYNPSFGREKSPSSRPNSFCYFCIIFLSIVLSHEIIIRNTCIYMFPSYLKMSSLIASCQLTRDTSEVCLFSAICLVILRYSEPKSVEKWGSKSYSKIVFGQNHPNLHEAKMGPF